MAASETIEIVSPGLEIRAFDVNNVSDDEWVALNTFENRMKAESWPDDPPTKLERTVLNFRSSAKQQFLDSRSWHIWSSDGSEIVAAAGVSIWSTGSNEHVAHFGIQVLPQHRRRGMARRLLERAVAVAERADRKLLITHTEAAIPGGQAFAKSAGGRHGITDSTSELELATVDRELLHRWQQLATERASGYRLEFLGGAYPEDQIGSFVEMFHVVNTEPREDLEVEDHHFTAEQVRSYNSNLADRRGERWTMYAVDASSGEFAGYTELMWGRESAEVLGQGETAVLPDHRNKGLGRWLKAAMMDKVLTELPQARLIRTSNAASNEPMLKINHEMGFKPCKSYTAWQIDLPKVREYLAAR